MRLEKRLSSKSRLFQYTLVLIWLFLNLLNLQVGLADNGDWIRLASWFAPTPVGFETLWVDHTSPLYLARYFSNWLPLWNIDFAHQGHILSSALLLWMPGFLLNKYFFSSTLLFLPWLSLLPRILILALLVDVFHWIEKNTHRKHIFYLTLAFPLVLIASTMDYIAYFNTFYQETAAFVGLLFLLWAICALGVRFSWPRLGFFFLALCILTFARASLVYWPFLIIPFVWSFVKRRGKVISFFLILLAVLFAWAGLKLSSNQSIRELNSFNTIFTGILPFSDAPQKHLDDHHLQGSEICIDNIDYHSAERAWCVAQYQAQLTRKTSLQMLIAEPAIVFQQFLFVTSEMQQLSLSGFEYPPFNLNNFALGVDRSTWIPWLNAWSNLKSAFFPRGWGLIVSLLLFGFVFVQSLKQNISHNSPGYILAILGLLLLAGLLIDMLVTINGDGKYELTKHLYLSNLMFDLNLLLAINLLIFRYIQKPTMR